MQRYFAVDKRDDLFILESSDLHHISNVMRMKDGDFVEVVFDKVLYKCKVVIDNGITIIYDSILHGNDDPIDIVLIVPILKEQKMDLVLQKATELGATRIIPIITERCIVKLNDKESKKLERWSRIVKEASEQCKRISIPIIDNVHTISDLNFSDGVKLVCSTRENEKNIKNIMHNLNGCAKMYIVVGPEGGLSIDEENTLNDLGFVSITLGKRIMRVETVPMFVLSILNYELME
ncbi:MAG: RsmE family RNA methyltransferase [Bacilli bacterium]